MCKCILEEKCGICGEDRHECNYKCPGIKHPKPSVQADARPSDDDLKECEHGIGLQGRFVCAVCPKPKEKSNKATAQDLPKIEKLNTEKDWEVEDVGIKVNDLIDYTRELNNRINAINNLNSR